MIYWIIALLLVGIGIALFVLPHHKGDFEFASLSRDLRDLVQESADESPGVVLLKAIVGFGCLAVFLPAVLTAAIALWPAGSLRSVLIVGGLALIAAGLSTFLVEIFSNMLIGWGSGSKYKQTTAVAYLAPLFPLVCGVASIVLGALRVRLP